MSRRGSMWQLKNQRSMSILDARICLPQQLLGSEVCGAACAKPGSGGRRFGSLCQRSVTTGDGCRTGSGCPTMSAPGLLYIVGGIREILTSVAPLELRQV